MKKIEVISKTSYAVTLNLFQGLLLSEKPQMLNPVQHDRNNNLFLRWRLFTILFILVGLSLTSCISEFKEISISKINGFNVTKMSSSGIEGEINVTITNPNNTSFKVYKSKADITYGDAKLGTARIVKKVKVPANSSIDHTFVLKGDLKDLSLASLPNLMMGKGKKMEINGYIKAGKWFYKKKFPIDEKQKIPSLDFKGGIPGFR
jgi:LEA14-like dessication related protein